MIHVKHPKGLLARLFERFRLLIDVVYYLIVLIDKK